MAQGFPFATAKEKQSWELDPSEGSSWRYLLKKKFLAILLCGALFWIFLIFTYSSVTIAIQNNL